MVVIPISNTNHFQNKRLISSGFVKSIVMHPCIERANLSKLAVHIRPFRLQTNVYFPMARTKCRARNTFCPNLYVVQSKLMSNKLMIINTFCPKTFRLLRKFFGWLQHHRHRLTFQEPFKPQRVFDGLGFDP